MTLVTKCVASNGQRRLNYISHLYSSKDVLLSLHLLTRQSAIVLKVGVSYVWKMQNASPVIAKGKVVLSVYIAAKDILAAPHY